jgi:hypothetical protein
MSNRVVIPNEVRDLTNGVGSRKEICVTKVSIARSFASLRMTGGVL